MSYIKTTLIIFVLLGSSRFIPHPPNFTSLIALSFYLPAIFGRKFIPIILIGFILTDLFIGIHNYHSRFQKSRRNLENVLKSCLKY